MISFLFFESEHLEDANVGEDHDEKGPVEGDGAGEDEVAQVLREQALPVRRRPYHGNSRLLARYIS